MANTEIFELGLLESQLYGKQLDSSCGIFEKVYIVFAGAAVCMRVKIQNMGYRLLQSVHSEGKSTLVLIKKVVTMSSNEIKGSFSLIKNFGNKITLNRVNLGVHTLCNTLLPKISQVKQLWIYGNSQSIGIEIMKQIVCNEAFLVSVDRQQLQINLCWLKDKDFMKDIHSNTGLLLRRLVAQNEGGKYTNYLNLNIRAFAESEEEIRYGHCVFVPNRGKLVVQQAEHYKMNEIVKVIRLSKLYERVFGMKDYLGLHAQLVRCIDDRPEKKMILLQTSEGLGISSYLHAFAQKNQYNFVRINCRYLSSEKQLIERVRQSDSYTSTMIYIKNIQWLLEVGSTRIHSKAEMKDIVKDLQEVFFGLGDQVLASYVLVIGYQGNLVKMDMTKNGEFIRFELEQQEKLAGLGAVMDEMKKQMNIAFVDEEQVMNLVVNSVRWATFAKIMRRLKSSTKVESEKISTQRVLVQIGKVANMQKVDNIKNVRWEDVGGLSDAKQQIIQTILLPIKSPQIFDQKIKPRTGLLFYGPPGSGKTMLGKCIANECKMSFISVKGPQLLNMYVGESEKNVREVFERAAGSKPCIVFMDQLDALIPKRGQSADSNQVMDRIVSELLAQMDKAPSRGIFIIGATNRPDLLDPSILRPGRFDKQIYLGIPKSNEERIQILKAQTRHLVLHRQFNYEKILKCIPENFTGADFYGLTSRAVIKAAERFIEEYENDEEKVCDREIEIEEDDFIEVVKVMKCSVSIQEMAHYEKLRQLYK